MRAEIKTVFGPRCPNPPWRVAVLLRSRSPSWPMDRTAQSAVEALDRAGCVVRVVTVPSAASARVGEFLRTLRKSGIDGAIDLEFAWSLRPNSRLDLWKFPLVSANGAPPFARADAVAVDEVAVARQMLDHFESLGHDRCGYLMALDFPHAIQRLQAFENEMRRRDKWEPSLVLDLRAETARVPYQALELRRFPVVREFFRRQSKPFAMWSHNDFVSAALVEWLLEEGYRVPHDVAVAGVDNHELYSLANVPLTTAALPFAEMGQRSVELLLRRLKGNRSARCQRVLLSAPLLIRESTAGRPEEKEWLNAVLQVMKGPLHQPRLVRSLAERLGWRQDVLAQRFRRAMGCTLLEYRDQLRLEQARKQLLQKPYAKVESVARESGFSSASRFAAAFRERFGVNPTKYRATAGRRFAASPVKKTSIPPKNPYHRSN